MSCTCTGCDNFKGEKERKEFLDQNDQDKTKMTKQ